MSEDPIRNGENWYSYCKNNPIKFIDPMGLAEVAIRDFLSHYGGTVSWDSGSKTATGNLNNKSANFSQKDFHITNKNGTLYTEDSYLISLFDLDNNDTYKIINDLGKRWGEANNQIEKDRLHGVAEDARRMEREGTPYQYAQDKIMNTLHENVNIGRGKIIEKSSLSDSGSISSNVYLWFIDMTFNDWNYKVKSDWQVPYDNFNGLDMNVDNNKNWKGWMYFDGMILAGDDVGNMNLSYVGKRMGFSDLMLANFATMDDEKDTFFINYGLNLANSGR